MGGQVRAQDFAIRPKLYVLAVGVSDYEDDRLRLQYAAKDARDFAAAAKAMGHGPYRECRCAPSRTRTPAAPGSSRRLKWLSSLGHPARCGHAFLAGHGVNDADGTYYFLPYDADPGLVAASGVIFAEIKRTVENLAGKRVVFVDTCHAGNVMGRRGGTDINAVVSELASASSGAVVFSSSTGNQYSLEKSEWGNGAFTKALVEGLSGKADMQGTGGSR